MEAELTKLPRALRRALEPDLRLVGAVLRALLRRPIAASPITFTRESSYPGIALGLAIAAVVEGGVVHLLLDHHPRAQAALLALAATSLLWLIGDLRALREATCRFEQVAVRVELGLRGSVRIPYRAIEAVSAPDPVAASSAHVFRLTPGDAPNVRIDLRRPVVARTFRGLRRRARAICLYVDDPAVFRTRLEEARRRSRGTVRGCSTRIGT